MALTVTALQVGVFTSLSRAALMFQRGYFEDVSAPITMFVITGGDHPIVVDTGGGSPEQTMERHAVPISQDASEHPLAALESLGIDPADVGTVVNTHLHWDHCSNNDLFPNARIVVQKSELAYAMDPFEPNLKVYERLPGMEPLWLSSLGRMTTIDGDEDLAPGVRAVHLPGHSPGSQGVVVSAAGRDWLIAGDCVSCYGNWEGDERARHIPSAYTDMGAYMASFGKIERLGCGVIPSHDFRVIDQRTFS